MVGKKPVSGNKVKIRYLKASSYRRVPANGVFGGMTPRGDLLIDFILDSLPTPDSAEQEVRPDGSLGDVSKVSPKVGWDRELQVGVFLSLDHAESIAQWMLIKVAEARKAVGDTKEQETIQ